MHPQSRYKCAKYNSNAGFTSETALHVDEADEPPLLHFHIFLNRFRRGFGSPTTVYNFQFYLEGFHALEFK